MNRVGQENGDRGKRRHFIIYILKQFFLCENPEHRFQLLTEGRCNIVDYSYKYVDAEKYQQQQVKLVLAFGIFGVHVGLMVRYNFTYLGSCKETGQTL